MKVIIPVAGLGSRLKPHTFTVAKPLMEVAGKPIVDYIIEDTMELEPTEYIFVVGYKRQSVQEHLLKKYPNLNMRFVYQKTRDGDGSAIRLALEDIEENEDVFIVFGDTMVDLDYREILKNGQHVDSLVLGMSVPNPSHYGVMNVNEVGDVYEVEEKPKHPQSNLAIIGAYYFKSSDNLKTCLNEFYKTGETVKGEYKLIQAIEKYIRVKELSVKVQNVDGWFDCGRPEVLLEANRYFLQKMSNSTENKVKGSSVIIPPSYIAKDAVIENSVIGPFASIGEGAQVRGSVVSNTILSSGAEIKSLVLKDSIIGKEAKIIGSSTKLNVGEKSEINMN